MGPTKEELDECHAAFARSTQSGRVAYMRLVQRYGHSQVHFAWVEWRKGKG